MPCLQVAKIRNSGSSAPSNRWSKASTRLRAAPLSFSPGPIFLERGQGSHVWDADSNEYIDFMMSFGALIQGHAHPRLVEVVSQAMAQGSHFAAATSAEVEAAERLRRMVPFAEVVRFANSGSEATMLALRLARAHTGRNKFLKFEGHYHGWYDPYLLNAHSHAPEKLGPPENPTRMPDSEGIPASTSTKWSLRPGTTSLPSNASCSSTAATSPP